MRGIVAGALGRTTGAATCALNRLQRTKRRRTRLRRACARCGCAATAWKRWPMRPPLTSCFHCPPYGDLEKYSDDPRDLSRWLARLRCRVQTDHSARRGAPEMDTFACFVVATSAMGAGSIETSSAKPCWIRASWGAALQRAILATPVGTANARDEAV